MFTMTRVVTLSLVHSVIRHFSPYFYLWVPEKVGLLYSPALEDERFFRVINDMGDDYRAKNAPWLGFIYSRQPIATQDGRRHEGIMHTRAQRMARDMYEDTIFRFRTRVRTPVQFKFYSNDALTIERLEEHFIVGPFSKDLVARITLDSETFDINFRIGYGGEDSDVEIGGLEREPFGLVSTLTKTLYADYPLLWFYQDRDGNLIEIDSLTGEPVKRKLIRRILYRVFYKDSHGGEPILLFEESIPE